MVITKFDYKLFPDAAAIEVNLPIEQLMRDVLFAR